MNFKKAAITAIAGTSILTSMFTACTVGNRNVTPSVQEQGNRNQIIGTEVTPAPIAGQRLNATPGQRLNMTPGINNPLPKAQTGNQTQTNNQKRADDIKKQLEAMNELKEVNVFVLGNAALIGYSPESTNQDINSIKNMIINKVKESDKGITNVTVSESEDIMARIDRLRNDMTNNRPANELTDDFTNIIKSIAPVNR